MIQEPAVLEQRIHELECQNKILQRQVDDLQYDLSEKEAKRRANDIHYQVTEFQGAFGYPVRTTPQVPPDDEVRLRAKLSDEYFELLEALFGKHSIITDMRWGLKVLIEKAPTGVDMVELADALADCDYVNEGCRIVFGIPGKAVAREVHRSNMTKVGGGYVNGKLQKGPNYEPPRIARVLMEHGWSP